MENSRKEPNGVEADATSKQTLEDLEANEQIPESHRNDGRESQSPSPDAQTDEKRDHRDDAGLM